MKYTSLFFLMKSRISGISVRPARTDKRNTIRFCHVVARLGVIHHHHLLRFQPITFGSMTSSAYVPGFLCSGGYSHPKIMSGIGRSFDA